MPWPPIVKKGAIAPLPPDPGELYLPDVVTDPQQWPKYIPGLERPDIKPEPIQPDVLGPSQGTNPWYPKARQASEAQTGLKRQRDNLDDMFTAEQNFARNKQWAKPGPYITKLSPEEEQGFQQWMAALKAKYGNKMLATADDQSYDMRGFYKALRAGDPRAKPSINPHDGLLHFPDTWKTPYEATFSNQSIYAQPYAPQWKGNFYMLPNGRIIFDDAIGKWYGTQ